MSNNNHCPRCAGFLLIKGYENVCINCGYRHSTNLEAEIEQYVAHLATLELICNRSVLGYGVRKNIPRLKLSLIGR